MSYGDQMLILPLKGRDLFELTEQQIRDALMARREDLFILSGTLRVLFSYLIYDSFETRLREERWSRDLGRAVDMRLGLFSSHGYPNFQSAVIALLEVTGDMEILTDTIMTWLWDIYTGADQLISIVIRHHQAGQRFLPPSLG